MSSIHLFGPRQTWRGQEVLYVTERGVPADGALALTEIAPGIDLRHDVLERMQFAPLVERSGADGRAHFTPDGDAK